MYIDIKQLKAIQAKAVAAKIGSSIIEPIMKDIKNAAARGDSEICITYKNYKMDRNIADMVNYWASICGFVTAIYSYYMYIKW